jgi:hypothetical protein
VERRRRGGFRSGLLLVLIIGGIGAGLYHGRDEIVGLAPQAAAPLDGYIAAVDDGKAQAMIWADQAMAKIKPMIGQDAPAPAPEAAPAAPTPAASTPAASTPAAPAPAAPAPTPEPAAPQAAAPVNAAPTAPAPRAPIASMTTDPASAPIAMPSMPTMSAPATPAAPEPSPMPSTPSTN